MILGFTRLLVFLVLFRAALSEGQTQGTFQNFDFESATLIPIQGDPYGRVQFSPALPGWSGIVDGAQQSAALYNDLFLNSSGIGIIGSSSVIPDRRIDGNFKAFLEASVSLSDPNRPADASLSQTGLIPFEIQSLTFKAAPGAGPFEVTLGGQSLSLIPMSAGTNYTLFGADVHAWAGQTTELKFTAVADRVNLGRVNNLFLDSIQFSSVPIPEPSVLALGSVLFGLYYSWRRITSKRSSTNS